MTESLSLSFFVNMQVYMLEGGKIAGAVGTHLDLTDYLKRAEDVKSIFVVGTPVLDSSEVFLFRKQLFVAFLCSVALLV